ncbi:MAG TPA: ribosome biogenesis GTPase Der [Candidatus Atribacteria bacterium]|nr:ribosome biogenesis GTPase Der [Candidatus Atribacteria bacterium]
MNREIPLVVIAGKTNVGKSTLFNRLSGRRITIVDSTPGVTRDIIENIIEIEGVQIRLVDTAGIELAVSPDDPLQTESEKKVWEAIKKADCILLVLDGKEEMTSVDHELISRLRRVQDAIIPVVNKREGMTHLGLLSDFYTLGFDDVVQISAVHGDGIPQLKSILFNRLKRSTESDDAQQLEHHDFRIAIVGKPNVGKSTLFNMLLESDRSIVSTIPGTTRDPLESSLISGGCGRYQLVDTAGLARKSRIKEDIAFYATVRTMEKIAETNLCVLVLDVLEGISQQDRHIANEIYQQKKCCLIFLNKMDLIPERLTRKKVEETKRWIWSELNLLDFASVLVGSATDQNLKPHFLAQFAAIASRYYQRLRTSFINREIKEKINDLNISMGKGRLLRTYYGYQELNAPPRFSFLTNFKGNDRELERSIHSIEKIIRQEGDWEGVPLRIELKNK